MSRLFYVDLNSDEETYTYPNNIGAPLGDIYLAGDCMQDLVQDFYDEKYYVLLMLNPNTEGFIVAPFDDTKGIAKNKAKTVKMLKRVCTCKNIDSFYIYVENCLANDFYEKQKLCRPFGYVTHWKSRCCYDTDVDFVKREYIAHKPTNDKEKK